MLVGIGFIAIVTAAIAQKVVVAGVVTEVDTVELEAEQDLRIGEAHVLGELRDLRAGYEPWRRPSADWRSEHRQGEQRPTAIASSPR